MLEKVIKILVLKMLGRESHTVDVAFASFSENLIYFLIMICSQYSNRKFGFAIGIHFIPIFILIYFNLYQFFKIIFSTIFNQCKKINLYSEEK